MSRELLAMTRMSWKKDQGNQQVAKEYDMEVAVSLGKVGMGVAGPSCAYNHV